MRRFRRQTLLFATLVGAILLVACSGDPALTDRLVENQGAEAFLDRVAKNCGTLSVGNQTLEYLLDESSNDSYFIDESSKLYFGKVDRDTYSTDINSFYPTDDNGPALNCIFGQLAD
jgi:hypothetical protein